ncbi:MAG: hypothetical protein RIK87_03515 [Fuerstiella sp.]
MSDSGPENSDDGCPEADAVDGQPTERPEVLPSFAELQHLLQQNPDAGTGRLEQIRRRLQTGHYLTRAAAEESARRMLDDNDIRADEQQ